MLGVEQFNIELGRIRNIEVRKFVSNCLLKAPEHFWLKPSSSTGKYHLKDEFCEGGLIKHTKRVCSVAEILMRASTYPINYDAVRAACILHDICKYGSDSTASEHTVESHPYLAAKLLKEIPGPLPGKEIIINAVERHMGKWGFNKPKGIEDRVVHLSDVIATNYVS